MPNDESVEISIPDEVAVPEAVWINMDEFGHWETHLTPGGTPFVPQAKLEEETILHQEVMALANKHLDEQTRLLTKAYKHIESLAETIMHLRRRVLAADALAAAACATFGPTKGKTGNEGDELDTAIENYSATKEKT